MHRTVAFALLCLVLTLVACSQSPNPTDPGLTPAASLELTIDSDVWSALEPPTVTHSMGRITIVSRRMRNATIEEFSLAMLDTISVGRHVLHADSAACAYLTFGTNLDSASMSNVRLYTGWVEVTKHTSNEIEGTFEAHFGYSRKRGAGWFKARLAH